MIQLIYYNRVSSRETKEFPQIQIMSFDSITSTTPYGPARPHHVLDIRCKVSGKIVDTT